MTKDIWINLPAKDINKSRDFFIAIGFKANEGMGNSEHSAAIKIGSKNIILMLFEENVFKNIVGRDFTDTTKSSEVLFSFDAESKEEIDELAKKVEKAGGSLFSKPAEMQGWMYGFGFSDLDGHRWNALHMDFSKMK
jgi:predicted lactoylglutathione lyase